MLGRKQSKAFTIPQKQICETKKDGNCINLDSFFRFSMYFYDYCLSESNPFIIYLQILSFSQLRRTLTASSVVCVCNLCVAVVMSIFWLSFVFDTGRVHRVLFGFVLSRIFHRLLLLLFPILLHICWFFHFFSSSYIDCCLLYFQLLFSFGCRHLYVFCVLVAFVLFWMVFCNGFGDDFFLISFIRFFSLSLWFCCCVFCCCSFICDLQCKTKPTTLHLLPWKKANSRQFTHIYNNIYLLFIDCVWIKGYSFFLFSAELLAAGSALK